MKINCNNLDFALSFARSASVGEEYFHRVVVEDLAELLWVFLLDSGNHLENLATNEIW